MSWIYDFLDSLDESNGERAGAYDFFASCDESSSIPEELETRFMESMPSVDEVLAYANGQINVLLDKLAWNSPLEHREEMAQLARMRVWRKYGVMDVRRGWKAFVQKQVRGAILDYTRAGVGFIETKRMRDANGQHGLRQRISTNCKDEDEAIDLDKILGFTVMGQEVEVRELIDVNWDLLARLARRSPGLHIFVRHVLFDVELSQLEPIFGVTRERLSQVFHEFLASLDDPKFINDRFTNQVIYALGLSRLLGVPAVDNGQGWTLEPVDFTSTEPYCAGDRKTQMNFDLPEGSAATNIVKMKRKDRVLRGTGEEEALDAHLQMNLFEAVM